MIMIFFAHFSMQLAALISWKTNLPPFPDPLPTNIIIFFLLHWRNTCAEKIARNPSCLAWSGWAAHSASEQSQQFLALPFKNTVLVFNHAIYQRKRWRHWKLSNNSEKVVRFHQRTGRTCVASLTLTTEKCCDILEHNAPAQRIAHKKQRMGFGLFCFPPT